MKSSKKIFLLAFLLTTLTMTNIIVHDFFCHEELHHLVSPLHHSFNYSSFNPQDFIQTRLTETSVLSQENREPGLASFVPSIFHPPD